MPEPIPSPAGSHNQRVWLFREFVSTFAQAWNRTMMELRHLRYLISVSERSTFVKAAEQLRLAQPALTRQIRALERELGAPLFIRGPKGSSLTAAGVIALGSARSIVRNVDAAVARARLAEAGRAGSCAFYVSVWAAWSGFSARLISHLRQTEPDIKVRMDEGGAVGHWNGVRSGELDFAISTKPPPGYHDLSSAPLVNDVIDTVLLAPSHPLAGRDSIQLSELGEEPFITYSDSVLNLIDHDIERAFANAGFRPASRRVQPSTEAVLAMVSAGMGWSVHRHTLRERIPDVATVPVRDLRMPFPVTLVWRSNENRRIVFRVMRRVRELAAALYPELYAGEGESASDKKSTGRGGATHNVDLRGLRYFSAAVEERSIGRAAAKLGISQPGLSRQLKELEIALEVQLLERSTTGVRTTAAGEAFYQDVQPILSGSSRLASEIARGERAIAGEVRIAGIPSAEVRTLINSVTADTAARFREIALNIQSVPTPSQPAAIADGNVDIGLCHAFPGLVAEYPYLSCTEIMPDQIDSALISASHPLASKESIELADLHDVPFLFFGREFHPAFYDYLMDVFRSRGFRVLEGAMQQGLQTMWALTAAGEGWSLGFGRQRNDPPAGVASVPLRDLSIPWGVVMLSRSDESRPTVTAVMAAITRLASS
jgi:DNA-binding transcriptional LysR family regulator